MAAILPIPVTAPRENRRGFTLTEVLITSTITGIIMLAVLQAFVFIGRGTTRMENFQTLEQRSRRTLAYLTRDVRLASAIASPTANSMTLTLPAGTVTYTFNTGTRQLTRTATFGSATSLVLLSDVVTGSFSFNYLDAADGSTLTAASIKKVEVRYSMQRGNSANRTAAFFNAASARIVFRNKNYLSSLQ